LPLLYTVIMPLFLGHTELIIRPFGFTVKRLCIVGGRVKGE